MKHIGTFFLISTMFAMSALAGDDGKDVVEAPPGPFDRGAWELEAGAGEFGSFSTTSATRKTIDYEIEDVRLGWMYDSPRHNGLLRGNNEFLAELFCGPVIQGPGNILGGGAIFWRYNFVQPGAKLIPYIQMGGGGLGNDIYHDQRQREIGEDFEFVLQGDMGLKYLINDHWSVSAEADFRHISNADLASRNQGLNSLGGLMLVSYVFH
jgi:hypothetical protein